MFYFSGGERERERRSTRSGGLRKDLSEDAVGQYLSEGMVSAWSATFTLAILEEALNPEP